MNFTISILCGIGLFALLIALGMTSGYFRKKALREDTRSASRFRFQAGPVLHWLENGKQITVKTKAVDISDSGAQVTAKESIQVGKTIYMHIPELGMTGRAVVRHCTEQRMNRFALGIEFLGPPTRSSAKKIKLSHRSGEERVELIG
jgi:hypothetical protein